MHQHERGLNIAVLLHNVANERISDSERMIARIEESNLGAEDFCGAVRLCLADVLDPFDGHPRLFPQRLGFPPVAIQPATVPAYLPPTSIAAFHEGGVSRSFEKLAAPIASTQIRGSVIRVATMRKHAAPRSPVVASRRRAFARLPRTRASRGT